jgi:hypothetical protein
MVGERVYRVLLLLYPPSFRRAYRHEMLGRYQDARRDRIASWPRLALDVVVTAPHRHQEAFMQLDTAHKLGIAAILLTVGIVGFALVGGALAALVLAMLLAWTLVAFLKNRGASPTEGTWWKLAVAGLALFALIVAVFAPPWPESWRSTVPDELAYWTVIFGLIFAIVLVAAGLLAAIAQLMTRRHATR